MKYEINGGLYDVVVQKKNNKNTYLRVKDDLTILITTNFFTSRRSILKLLKDHEKDLIRMMDKKCKQKEKEENFYYLGKKYDIIIVSSIDQITFDEEFIFTPSKEKLERWLKQQVQQLFQEHLDTWYPKFQEKIPYPKLKIRKMKTRWGVCNRRDLSVTLNFNLIKYDLSALDYVIVHELSHFVHFDHSKEFWNTVGKYYPEYKKITKMLKE